MGAIEDVRNLLQDIVAPDIKAIVSDIGSIKERVSALEQKLDKNHSEQMAAINQLSNYLNLADRVAKIESKVQ